jgi:hypothetical protein
METLQTLLLRADWAKSFAYTIESLMAPWGRFLSFLRLLKQFWYIPNNWGHLSLLFGYWETYTLIFVNFKQLSLCLSITVFFFVLTIRVPGEGDPGNLEFGREVSKMRQKIVPPRNWIEHYKKRLIKIFIFVFIILLWHSKA